MPWSPPPGPAGRGRRDTSREDKAGVHEEACQGPARGSGGIHTELPGKSVGTPILSHTDLACNTSYHFAASRTVLPRVPPYLARDRLRLLAHVYDSVASIHMIRSPG